MPMIRTWHSMRPMQATLSNSLSVFVACLLSQVHSRRCSSLCLITRCKNTTTLYLCSTFRPFWRRFWSQPGLTAKTWGGRRRSSLRKSKSHIETKSSTTRLRLTTSHRPRVLRSPIRGSGGRGPSALWPSRRSALRTNSKNCWRSRKTRTCIWGPVAGSELFTTCRSISFSTYGSQRRANRPPTKQIGGSRRSFCGCGSTSTNIEPMLSSWREDPHKPAHLNKFR